MFSLELGSLEYNGKTQTPVLTVKDGDHILKENTDYTVTGDSAKEIGNYTITVSGKNGYSGTASIGWSIEDKTSPAISGVTNGEEYTQRVNFSITDLLLDTVTLQKDSGNPQTLTVENGKASGSVSEPGTYTLTAKDSSSNTIVCTFTIHRLVYTVTDSSDTSWTQGSAANLSITVKRSFKDNECIDHFREVLVDGAALSDDQYDAAPGSTIITLKSSFLQKLSAGVHTIKICFDDSEAETALTIKAAEATSPETTPATGDSDRLALWIAPLLLSCAALAALIIIRRKRRFC